MINGFNVNGQDLDTYLVPRSYFNQGTLWTWGYNGYYGLGDSTNISKSSPVQTVASGLNWKQSSAANSFGTGIKTDGTIWTWGKNNFGQLGTNNTTIFSSPVQVVGGGTNWKNISAGWNATQSLLTTNGTCVAIKTDGSLWGWGYNNFGQLGNNSAIGSTSSPVQTVAGTSTWVQASVQLGHTLAIKSNGQLWAWGQNNFGQLGNNAITSVSSPIQTVASGTNWRSCTAGSYHSAAIKTDGTLWLWGRNYQGQLGDNTNSNSYSSPIQTVAGGRNWTQVAIGGSNFSGAVAPSFTAAIKTDGTLWTWGQNSYGQLGDNTRTPQSSPIQTVSGGTNWKQISAGYAFMMGVKTDGTLWTWGWNSTPNMGGTGQLGDNTTVSKSSPVQTAAGGTNWSSCSAGYGMANAITFVYN